MKITMIALLLILAAAVVVVNADRIDGIDATGQHPMNGATK